MGIRHQIKCFWLLMGFLLAAIPSFAAEELVFTRVEGFGADITEQVIKEAYGRIGIQVRCEPHPAERALSLAGSGEADGEVSRVPGIEKSYPDLIMIPVAITQTEVSVFTKTVIFQVHGWESLRPYTIGIQGGAKFAREGTAGMKIEAVTTDEQLFKKLDDQRIDIVVTTYINGMETIRKLSLKDIKSLSPPLATLKLYHYLHKKHSDLVQKITQTLKQMESEGRMTDIRRQMIEIHFK